MNTHVAYRDNMQKPWSQLMYQMMHRRLGWLHGARVLDFGSGLGITASAMAQHNDVLAIEPDEALCAMRVQEHPYELRVGGIEALRDLPRGSFDAVLCHNVLEYIGDKDEVMAALVPLLCAGGTLSLVQHNRAGRIVSRAVYEQNPSLALAELHGQSSQAVHFGAIGHYDGAQVAAWCHAHGLQAEGPYGIRMFWALGPNNESKYDKAWQEASLALEWEVAGTSPYRDIAFFHHWLLSSPPR